MNVSIGICAYNEEENIGTLLGNLSAQHFPQPFNLHEIIVVSSGSTDRTNDIVTKLSEKDLRIKLITEKERGGKAQALNIFFNAAKGDILVVISADTKIAQGSIARLVETMKPSVGGACAKTLPREKNPAIVEFCYWFLWKVHNRALMVESKNGTLSHLGGDMWAVRRGIVPRIPREVINDDAYLGIALRKKGWQIVFVPEAEVLIGGPATPTDYIQQRVRIVIGHKQLKEMTGVEPTTIGALAFRKPVFSLKMLLNEIRTHRIADYPKIAMGLFLEVVAQTLARMRYKKRKEYLKWRQIRSTKTV